MGRGREGVGEREGKVGEWVGGRREGGTHRIPIL